jgi:hypothetical protein
MPEKLKRILQKQAHEKGYRGERADTYVYGTLANIAKKKHKLNKP